MLNTLTHKQHEALAESTLQLFNKVQTDFLYDERHLDLLTIAQGTLIEGLLVTKSMDKEQLDFNDLSMHTLRNDLLDGEYTPFISAEPTSIEEMKLHQLVLAGLNAITAYDFAKYTGYTHEYIMQTIDFLLDALNQVSEINQQDIANVYYVPALVQTKDNEILATAEITQAGLRLLIGQMVKDEMHEPKVEQDIDSIAEAYKGLTELFEKGYDKEAEELARYSKEVTREYLDSRTAVIDSVNYLYSIESVVAPVFEIVAEMQRVLIEHVSLDNRAERMDIASRAKDLLGALLDLNKLEVKVMHTPKHKVHKLRKEYTREHSYCVREFNELNTLIEGLL